MANKPSIEDLHEMTLAELEELEREVQKVKVTVDKRRRAEARLALEKTAKEMGFSVEELLGGKIPGRAGGSGKPGKARAKTPKFVNPDDPTDTWSGLGRIPHWMREKLDAGHSKEDFLISKSDIGEGSVKADDKPAQSDEDEERGAA